MHRSLHGGGGAQWSGRQQADVLCVSKAAKTHQERINPDVSFHPGVALETFLAL